MSSDSVASACPNGTVVRLHAGEYEAAVASSGAMLLSVTKAGRDLVVPVAAERLPVAYQGKTLVPWPNRIVGGTYRFRGQTYEVPVNEHATGTALHGLACWQNWRVVRSDGAAVVFGLSLLPSYGYPFALEVTTEYQLSADGLKVSISATNVGTDPAPYGVSSHPYITCGGTIDDCALTIPADQVLLVDDSLGPEKRADVSAANMDYRNGPLVAGAHVDNAFTGLPGGTWHVTLVRPGDYAVAVEASAPWVQFFSGDHVGRRGAAIEPMSCAPDAFNSGDGLIVLQPGESHSFEWSLSGRAL